MNRMTRLGQLIGLALVLLFSSACGALQPTPTLTPVPPTPTSSPAMATESIVKAWIAAYAAQDADKYIALFGDDGEFMDTAEPQSQSAGPRKVKAIEGVIRGSINTFQVKITSYFISPDGRFAAAQGTFTMGGLTAPAVAILEFKDGKINRETWYYDGSHIYH